MDDYEKLKTWLIIAFTLAVIGGIMVGQTWAREGDDHGNHGDLKQWFDGLRSKKGMCCSFADGFKIEEIDYDTALGPDGKSHYRVKLPSFETTEYATGKKIIIPASKDYVWVDDEAVIEEPNKFGPAVVWPVMYNSGVIGVRCFMPGAGA